MLKSKSGFTIVELIVVVAVLAILAAIIFVGYNGVQTRTHKAVVFTDMNVLRDKLEEYRLQYRSYPHFDDPVGQKDLSNDEVRAGLAKITEFRPSTGSYRTQEDGISTNMLYVSDNKGEGYLFITMPKGTGVNGKESYYVSNTVREPTLYPNEEVLTRTDLTYARWNYQFPGGNPGSIGEAFGMQSASGYYVYTGDGWRLWN